MDEQAYIVVSKPCKKILHKLSYLDEKQIGMEKEGAFSLPQRYSNVSTQ